jgi:antitoxin (DNA-binding transcriptional repressor) of toxin-antitoxin stability system
MKVGYVMDMAGQAKISELKNRLSHYLGRVRRGESILVLDRDRVIARISPVGDSPSDQTDSAMLDDLERRGVVRRRGGRLPREWLSQRPTLKADLLAALLDERDEGR